jgi:serine phosphatase RsbU (regulator of sigma subunit)
VVVGRFTLLVLLTGLLIVGVLTWASWQSYQDNENSLLAAKGKEAGVLLSTATSTVQTSLAAGAELADLTAGSPTEFDRFMTPFVGKAGPFVSASLWLLDDPQAGPLVTVGSRPILVGQQQVGLLGRAARSNLLAVIGLLHGPTPRLGYAYHFGASRYVAYAEAALPANRRAAIAQSSAFSDLHYAIYLGRSANPGDLLATDVNHPLSGGRHSTEVVAFADSFLTLVVAPRGTLGASLWADLPWIIAAAGTVLALVAAGAAESLQRRRQEARALFAEQRNVARTLAQALLPERLPEAEGLETACRYEPGTSGLDVGGDWYGLLVLDTGKVFFIVGDVSGRGVKAAAVMARLRFASLAYAKIGDPPDVLLGRLSQLVSVDEFGHFATAVCGVIDVPAHEMVVANAGHPPPVLIAAGATRFVDGPVGLPVGVSHHADYQSVTTTVPAGATLLAFTDGLVERRGERIDISLGRLCDRLEEQRELPLDRMLDAAVAEASRGGLNDDIAILGLRWQD